MASGRENGVCLTHREYPKRKGHFPPSYLNDTRIRSRFTCCHKKRGEILSSVGFPFGTWLTSKSPSHLPYFKPKATFHAMPIFGGINQREREETEANLLYIEFCFKPKILQPSIWPFRKHPLKSYTFLDEAEFLARVAGMMV